MEEEQMSSSGDEIQATDAVTRKAGRPALPKAEKAFTKKPVTEKKPRTEAQKASWEKALATKKANAEARKQNREQVKAQIEEIKEEQEHKAKKQIEDKIVKKAISIKKKQIKKEAVLDEVSDDDTPIEDIKAIVKTRPQRPKQVKMPTVEVEQPKLIFY